MGNKGKVWGRGTGRQGTKGERRSQKFRDRGQRGCPGPATASSVPLHFLLMKAPSLSVPKPQSEATGLEPGAQHLVIALLAFSSFFSPSRAKGKKKKKGVLNGKNKKKRPLKASFKRLLGNGIVSMKQNCDCLEEVNAGLEWGREPRHPPLPQLPLQWEDARLIARSESEGAPTMAPTATSKEFSSSCFQKFYHWVFPAQGFALKQLCLWEFVLKPSGSLREVQ